MRILILGGTGFIGSNMARALVAAGHEVSVLSRGQTPVKLPADIEVLTGDRDTSDGLGALEGREWDACIDVSGFLPPQVRKSAELLSDVRRYVFVSAVAAYGDPAGPVTEEMPTPRLTPAEQDTVQSVQDLDNRTYGPSKVACEDMLREVYSDRLTVLRPQVVAGPGDPTERFSVWPARAAHRTEVVIPGDGSDFLQIIDVRDIAAFTVMVIERNLSGIFNLAGHRITWAEFTRLLRIEKPIRVPLAELSAHDVPWSAFPLYRPNGSVRSGLMNVSHALAQRAGLNLTPLEKTLADIRQSLSATDIERLGMQSGDEMKLLRR